MPVPASLFHIDIDGDELNRHHPAAVAWQADARLSLEALAPHLSPREPWALPEKKGPPWRLPGIDILGPLSRTLPDDAILSVDVTRLAYILMADFPLNGSRRFLHPAGSVAMGYGLPAALGAKAAFPDRAVLAVAGDGGFQMSGMELATAVQENLPVVVLLVNDGCLTLIKATQERRYESRFLGVDLLNPDFATFAKAFGVRHWLAEDDATLERCLRAAFAWGAPAVVEVRPGDARR
jgi:thiamine pyrophosphate-dependent acetolactate synthase large subunit-like protein